MMSKKITTKDFSDGSRCLVIDDGLIKETKDIGFEQIPDDEYILPGLVDCQVNGYGGADFNSISLTVKDIELATKKLWEQATTSYFPTLITNSHANISKLLKVFNNVKNEEVISSIAGFHIEGPFISPEDGARGAHPLDCVVAPQSDWVDEWQEITKGQIKIITVSPHWDGIEKFVSHCVAQRIHVAIGHTHASPEQIHAAAEAGASLSTHFGNGCQLMLPRHNNYLWAQLADDNLWTDFIGDGFHLPIDVLKVILRAKKNKCFLVSDTTYFGGMTPGTYENFIGGKVTLTKQGKVHLFENPNLLAGSAQSLLEAINFLIKNNICNFQEAWDLSSEKPYEFLNKGKGCFSVQNPANYVVVEKKDGQIVLKDTYVHNKLVYSKR